MTGLPEKTTDGVGKTLPNRTMLAEGAGSALC
jgi:hypothetical protein